MLKSTSIHKGVYNTLSVIKHMLKSYRPVCLYKHALLRKDGIIPWLTSGKVQVICWQMSFSLPAFIYSLSREHYSKYLQSLFHHCILWVTLNGIIH